MTTLAYASVTQRELTTLRDAAAKARAAEFAEDFAAAATVLLYAAEGLLASVLRPHCDCPAAANGEEPEPQLGCPDHGHLAGTPDPGPGAGVTGHPDKRSYEDIWGGATPSVPSP